MPSADDETRERQHKDPPTVGFAQPADGGGATPAARIPALPLARGVTAWLAAREDGPGAKFRCFTLSHLLFVGEAQRFADIHFHHTRDALLLHGHADQLLGHFHRDLVV